MSQRARRRHQRSHGGSVGKMILLGFGVLLAIGGIALASVGLWVQQIWADTPSIDSLKPINRGETSFVYAADGSFLGTIQADIVREPVDRTEVPDSLEQATIAIEDEHFYDHDGVDWGAVVRAAVENVGGGLEARQGGSTITQQLVKQPLHPGSRRDGRAQDPRGEAGDGARGRALEGLDPQPVPQHRFLRHQRRPDRGRRRGRVGGLLRQERPAARPEGVGAARRPAAGARREYNPFLNPHAAKKRRNEVLDDMDEQGYISSRRRAEVDERGPRPRSRPSLRDDPRALLLRLRRAGADRALRRPAGARGRPQGLHDDQPAAAELRRAGGRRCAPPAPPAPRPRWPRSTRPPAHILAMASSSIYAESQNNLAANAPPPARLLVQAVRADDGAQGGHRPRHHLLRRQQSEDPVPVRSVRRGVGRSTTPRETGGRLDEPRLRHDALGQRRLRPARPRRRPRERRRDRALAGDHEPARRTARPRASAVCGSASRRSRWPTPTRPSPTAASTTTRPRSRRSSSPPTTAATTARRRLRGPGGQPGDHRRRSPTRSPTSSRPFSTPAPAAAGTSPAPPAGKTGTTDEPDRRLVRRLHAEDLDRGLGRLPRLASRRWAHPRSAAATRRRSGRST